MNSIRYVRTYISSERTARFGHNILGISTRIENNGCNKATYVRTSATRVGRISHFRESLLARLRLGRECKPRGTHVYAKLSASYVHLSVCACAPLVRGDSRLGNLLQGVGGGYLRADDIYEHRDEYEYTSTYS